MCKPRKTKITVEQLLTIIKVIGLIGLGLLIGFVAYLFNLGLIF